MPKQHDPEINSHWAAFWENVFLAYEALKMNDRQAEANAQTKD